MIFAARAWCERNAGRARVVVVPSTNDDAAFYRAIAGALGIGKFLDYSKGRIQARVESVLKTGDIALVMLDAQALWPQKNVRLAFPSRLLWVFKQSEIGVPICLVAGPQFFMAKSSVEKTAWHSPEFQKFIPNLVELPAAMELDDLKAVAGVLLPEADSTLLEEVAAFALVSGMNLAAIENVAKRSDFIAGRAGNPKRSTADIVAAMRLVDKSAATLGRLIKGEEQKKRKSTAQPMVSTAQSQAPSAPKKPLPGLREVSPIEVIKN
jgi:hypothetical protein